MKCKKSKNIFIEKDNYMIGITRNGIEFKFDKIDYDLVKDYTWHIDGDGYVAGKINNKYVLFHRYILNAPRDMQVDHINHYKTDNRRKWLRLVTVSQNQCNSKLRRNKIYSKYKGVSFLVKSNKFVSSIYNKGKPIYLGSFNNDIDAALAYDKKAKELYGEYAYINFEEVI